MHTHKSHFLSILIAGLLLTIIFSPLLINVARADENPPLPVEEPPNKVYLPTMFTEGIPLHPEKALEIASEAHGIPIEELAVINTAQATYPLQALITTDYKIHHAKTGETFVVSLDPDQHPMDAETLSAMENTLYLNRYGKLDPELADKLTVGISGESIDVVVWLKEPAFEGLTKPERNGEENKSQESVDKAQVEARQKEVDEFLTKVQDERITFVAAVTAPVVQRLAELGYEVTADSLEPVIFAKLPPTAIKTVQNWEDIDRISIARQYQPTLEAARATIGASTVNNRTVNGYRINGRGVKVGVIEVNGRLASNNPYLSGVTNSTTNTCSYASDHATAVTGMIRSTASSVRGIAFGSQVWVGGSCDGTEAFIDSAAQRAVNWGARVLNLSLGGDSGRAVTTMDRYYDALTINYYRTIVIAAGNSACPLFCNGNVLSPALSYNTIAVGNFDDKNTASWAGDAMHWSSSYNDPISNHNDREKPEVSAPGTNINSTLISSPWIGPTGTGTSYAAPMVAGVTALLMQRDTYLQEWPEAIKAILMVTAVNNIEGDKRLSDKDGAGGISATRADDIAHDISGSWGGRAYSCTTGSPLTVASMYLQAGVRTRAAITWNNEPTYSGYFTRPSADLDLRIVDPNGNIIQYSSSWDNTYEIADFVPTTNGFHRISVFRASCYKSPKYLGWAWRRGN